MGLEVVSDISQEEFVERFVSKNQPVIVRGIPYSQEQWTPAALVENVGDLMTQVYDTLFDLENIMSLEEYIEDNFNNKNVELGDDVPYVRWYNQLKDAEFVWGDEAFGRLCHAWKKPNCIPDRGLVVPDTLSGTNVPDPVVDSFPYRAIQVAARGARTRLHRDPFCSDAVVSQFYGAKHATLYRPERADELKNKSDDTSFGGFVDARQQDDITKLTHEPDYQGEIVAGDMIYIPHGWLHDVLVMEDSISVTWNFIHTSSSEKFREYLQSNPVSDSEFEVLQYFFAKAGMPDASPEQILEHVMQAHFA